MGLQAAPPETPRTKTGESEAREFLLWFCPWSSS